MKGWVMMSSRITNYFAPQGIGTGEEGSAKGLSRMAALLCTALLLTACAPRVTETVPVQRSDLTLDLPLEPASPMKSRPAQAVQTVPPPLGSLRSDRPAVPSGLGQPKEFGIPARDSAAVVYAPSAATKKASVGKAKSGIKKKAVSKKKKAVVKKRTAVKKANTAPCVVAPTKVKKASSKATAKPAAADSDTLPPK
ncbi:hypothetical protein [Candidatus Magnetaquicoccus inordinatus]|uniref:hypothetical protein n=1 Tax=Candidatus Magnetaquicoccus inordinatus TaxID=2496818 RepID=UPI00102C6118|nr:hypothetical protein [Candidatus Magnetaquicoccus inordinatus]